MAHYRVMPHNGTTRQQRGTKFKQLTRLAIGLFILISTAQAQNRVVVIPMPGEDAPSNIFAPIANVDTSTSDYTLLNDPIIIVPLGSDTNSSVNTDIASANGFFPFFSSRARDDITQLQWQRGFADDFMNWDNAWDYCANLELAGESDWRLPTIKELTSIVDYGSATAPLIDLITFPNTPGVFFWSSSGRAISASSAWGVDFSNGNVGSGTKINSSRVRCVR